MEPILPTKHISQLSNYRSEEVANCSDPFSAAITKSWRPGDVQRKMFLLAVCAGGGAKKGRKS